MTKDEIQATIDELEDAVEYFKTDVIQGRQAVILEAARRYASMVAEQPESPLSFESSEMQGGE